MPARAIWKGVIKVGHAGDVPIKLYSALEDRKIHFKLLHRTDKVPVKQALIDPDENEPVAREDVRKGLPLDDHRFVVLEPDDLAEIEPPKSRDIEILRTIPAPALNDPWYDRPYWLGPDGDGDPYFALAKALEDEERVAVVRWTMRGKRQQGAIMGRDGHLALIRLHHAEEMVPLERLETPAGRAPDERELKLAEQLVGALADDFDPQAYVDEHRQQLSELIAAKAEGKVIELPKPEPKPEGASLEEALRASLGAMKKGA